MSAILKSYNKLKIKQMELRSKNIGNRLETTPQISINA